MMMILRDDPRHAAAQKAIAAMHEFWKLAPDGGAVQWIEDTDGRLLVFTRGEYRNAIRTAIAENLQPEQCFELADAGEPLGAR
jgi:hypothetical protein